MSNLAYKEFYRRHLPHVHPPNSTLFITSRLCGSIPRSLIRFYKTKSRWLKDELSRLRTKTASDDSPETQKWLERVERHHREWFVKFKKILDQHECGPTWLRDPNAAAALVTELHKLDDDAYRLDAYCVMSNHLHLVITPFLTVESLREEYDELGHLAFASEFPGLGEIMHTLKGRSAR